MRAHGGYHFGPLFTVRGTGNNNFGCARYRCVRTGDNTKRNLNVSKGSGPDLIPCRLLKGLAAEIAPILAEIFRQSLHDGFIPSIWKNADVAPVFKKGGRDKAKNYWPISLTCICCKILEHIISCHIRHHLDQYGILSPYQHGFRKLYSCEMQLLVTIQDLFHLDKHVPIDMLYWISHKLLMLFHTDVCWGSSAYTA